MLKELEANVKYIHGEIQEKLLPENIKKGVTFLGIEGNLESGIDTSDATATVEDLALDTTAYVNGQKITGTLRKLYGGYWEVPNSGNIIVDTNRIRLQTSERSETCIEMAGSKVTIGIPNDVLAENIGLNAEQIVKGQTILGVEGAAESGSPSMIEDPMLNANGITYQNYPKLLEQDCITLSSDDGMTELYAKIVSLYYDTDLRLQLLIVSSMESPNYVYYNMGSNSWINFYNSTGNLIGSYEIDNIYIMPDTRTNTVGLAYGGSMLGDDVASYTITTTQQT